MTSISANDESFDAFAAHIAKYVKSADFAFVAANRKEFIKAACIYFSAPHRLSKDEILIRFEEVSFFQQLYFDLYSDELSISTVSYVTVFNFFLVT